MVIVVVMGVIVRNRISRGGSGGSGDECNGEYIGGG